MGENGGMLALVRLRRGVVGESRRVCHLIPVPAGPVPAHLTALCGESIFPGEAEVLDGLRGMPCHACLVRSAPPGPGLLADAG
ncbi:hypothetical protein ACFVYA_26850 [Amycolatopsis sp. NPDC058278]|uniref:hypothetical protein n=1 Tax=unclassified Amycolatopsis TaxID=2618356 RepID=UPI00255C059F|nr:hypothetical protein [Amycolatopsis sp. DG1A-15b]WIX91824.1 hypothetical protein QRY02_15850 [Amycolatopsis sp. DG1A-15b]